MKYIIYFLMLLSGSVHASVLDTVPQTMNIGQVSSTWEGPEYADATDGIVFMQTPKANVSGNASMEFPIKLPQGRQDLQPALSIIYDSEETSSWLGYGWNLSLSSINLDTRWGVPQYSTEVESEIYLLDGEQMGPVFHRAAEYPREADRNFVLRQTTEFQTIIRHGDSPSNYWWEVQETDGIKKFYGGTPEGGMSTAHVLSSPNGIARWLLMKTIDSNGNNILYNYQKINGVTGVNIYPANIVFTGHDDSPGKYSVNFSLLAAPRADISSSGRLGFLTSQERLLARIEVLYETQQIRAYTFEYTTGPFGKTLLNAFQVLDANNEFFYDYNFNYYDDLTTSGSAYAPEVNWQVPKDNIAITNITGNIDGFNGKPTLLGSANSQSAGFESSVTVGFVAPPNTKDFTVGPTGGYSNNTSTGITALVDMNGDGLPDKLWKEDGDLYYRPNLFASATQGFGSKIKIEGISNFSHSSTNSWNLGAEVNVPPVYAGYAHEEGTTKTTTYFIDFNGDELIDIVNDGKVFFNYLNNDIPTYTEDVGLTPSIIYKGEALDPSIIEFDPAEQAEREEINPLHDAVRVWRAPYDGTININAPVQLIEDNSTPSQEYSLKDGVRVSLQIENVEYWSQEIAADDFTVYTPTNVTDVNVTAGDLIYFRVHSIYDGLYDEVSWNPTIVYSNNDYPTPDNQSTFVFNAEKDFILSEKKNLLLNQNGTIEIKSKVVKPFLSDDISLVINGIHEQEWLIDMNDVVDSTWTISGIQVSQGDVLSFKTSSESNVAWEKLTWEPMVIYTSLDDGSATEDEDGEPLYSSCGTSLNEGFFFNKSIGRPVALGDTDSVSISIDFVQELFIDYSVSIKLKGAIDSTMNIPFVGFEFDWKLGVENFDSIYVDVLFTKPGNGFNLEIESSTIATDEISEFDVVGLWENLDYKEGQYGSMYRGWGQFLYNGNDGRGFQEILLSELEIDEDEVANDTLQVDENSENTDLEGTGNNGELIVAMTSDPKLMAWRGSDEFAFVASSTMGSSRKGEKNVSPNSFNAGSGDKFTSPELITKYSSDGGYGGLGVPGTGIAGSAGLTAATSYSVLDVMDFNGDRYPDIISENSIQYSNVRGGLSSVKQSYEWGIHEAYSEAYSIGSGLSTPSSSPKNAGASAGTGSNKKTSRVKQKGRSNASKARSSFESASEAVGLSASFGADKDRSVHTFLDINGDALEDKIWENGDVALNLGYSFAPIQNWGFDTIRSGSATDFGAGVGINISNGSFLAGVSATKTFNSSSAGFVDLNGDALLDIIVSSDPIMVQFNTGNGFTDPVEWLDKEQWDTGESLGESVNAGFSFPLIFFWFKIVFNFQAYIGQGTGNIYEAFQDINGDGFPDFISAENSDDNLKARYSNIGRTNLLESVEYPFGAELTLDYEVKGNNVNLPYSKWTLNEIIMYDGVDGDGSDYSQQTFDYSNGFHDRHERQFIGFEEVVTNFHTGDLVNKKLVQKYQVDNYYTKGLITSIELYDEADRLHKSITYDYELKDIETGIILPPEYISTDDGMLFPALSKQTNFFTEGMDNISTEESYTFEYDLWGNIIKQHETDSNGYSKESRWTYLEDSGNGIKNRISKEQILGVSQLLSEMEKEYDERGNTTEIRSKIDDTNAAITNMEYDNFGNLTKIIKPENYKNERLEMSFTYEGELNQYRIQSQDNYGYNEEYQYEFLFGSKTSYTDKNGHVTIYGVDPKGRPAFSLNPMDAENGHSYSKQYSYELNSDVAYAICAVKNPEGEDIVSYAFFDGLQRMIQSKQVAITSNGNIEKLVSIVSGQNAVDSLGRVVKEYLEIEESINMISIYNQDTSIIQPIKYAYDINDRINSIEHIDGGKTTLEYSLQNKDNNVLFLANQTNPNGLITEYYFSVREELIAEKMILPGEESETKYLYNEISDILEITHPSGSKTFYTYDLLSTRLTVDIPDAGLTELVYDSAGNLLKKITANIRDGLQENASIRYTYDKERLLTINYPKNFQNKVEIHYGSPDALFNRAGRIWLQEDGTGGREYFYDVFGNVTKEIRTVIINRSEIFTYVTEFEHDALNRVTKIIYADGEELNYLYDDTGRLNRILGKKSDDEYVYMDNIHYDFYLERIKFEYGNGVIEGMTYDDKGRVDGHDLQHNNEIILDESYSYDLENQIIRNVNSFSDSFLGAYEKNNVYDEKGRLVASDGKWNNINSSSSYQSIFEFNPNNSLSLKGQEVLVNDVQDNIRSRTFDYAYENPAYPSRPSSVAGRDYYYDLNGNLSLVSSGTVFDFSQYVYDEENRLMGASENGSTSLYTYDAFGRRTIKSQGSIQGIFINGAPAGLVEHLIDYRVDVSPYFTVFKNDYRKHIFIDNLRVLSKIGTGVFQTNISDVPEITAGGIDYKARIQAYEQQILEYYASLGVPPGPPTLLAILGQPEINQVGFGDIDSNNPYEIAPPNWPVLNEPDSLGPPGAPVFYVQDGTTNETVKAGYNFINGGLTKELEQFYYHYDVQQNVNLVSGSDGKVRQYKMYLPSGEIWVRDHITIDSSDYSFAGLLYDEETGMYYMGEIYYDPVSNVELSVDKKAQTFGEETTLAGIEGNLYYDYADFQDNVSFDLQIINSEKPNPFIAPKSGIVDEPDIDDEDDDGEDANQFTRKYNAFTKNNVEAFTTSELKEKRREETLSPGSENSQTFAEAFEAFEELNLQSPQGVNPNNDQEFQGIVKKARQMKAKKKDQARRKASNKLKVTFKAPK